MGWVVPACSVVHTDLGRRSTLPRSVVDRLSWEHFMLALCLSLRDLVLPWQLLNWKLPVTVPCPCSTASMQ